MNLKVKKSEKKGFTLIELLIVIAIIGLLSSISFVSFSNVREKARDAKRLHEIKQIVLALQMYYQDSGRYPSRTADACCDGWDQGPCDGDTTFIQPLVTEGIISEVFTDPSGGTGKGCYGYSYYLYNAGSYGCDISRGRFYILGIRDMESSSRPHWASPGFRCTSRNWQIEFDWVTGGFEN